MNQLTTQSSSLVARAQRGFTILEILIVLAIIGLLMGLVGTKLFEQSDAAKVDVTRIRMQAVQNALMSFRLDVNRLPTAQEGLTALVRKPSDPAAAARWRFAYVDEEKLLDAWDRPLIYAVPGPNGAPFTLTSLGVDGKPGGEGLNADIVIPTNSAPAPAPTAVSPNGAAAAPPATN